MSEKFFFSLHDVDLDNDDQLHAFASRVWARRARGPPQTTTNPTRENEMTTTTHPSIRDAVYASDLHADQTRKSTAIPYFHLLGVSSLVLEAVVRRHGNCSYCTTAGIRRAINPR